MPRIASVRSNPVRMDALSVVSLDSSEGSGSVSRKARGERQSPINISAKNAEQHEDIPAEFRMEIAIVKGHVLFNETTENVSVRVDSGNRMFYQGKKYNLVELHFHSPSEHTFNNVRYNMELHMVHVAEDTTKLVFAVLFQIGLTESSFLKSVFNHGLPKNHGKRVMTRNIDIGELFAPGTESIFVYPGSLTTAPYSEDVTWCVCDQVFEASASQLAMFRKVIHGDNNRALQDLMGRKIAHTKVLIEYSDGEGASTAGSSSSSKTDGSGHSSAADSLASCCIIS